MSTTLLARNLGQTLRRCRPGTVGRLRSFPGPLQSRFVHWTMPLLDAEDGRGGDAKQGGVGRDERADGSPSLPRLPPISMSENDEPDFLDVADRILGGMSYRDAAMGTAFDGLSHEEEERFEEADRRLQALRRGELEEYLLSVGEHDMVEELQLAEEKRREAIRKLEKTEEDQEEGTVNVTRGHWNELVVTTDRVQKVIKGGMIVSFRALVVVGNEQGMGGYAIGKASGPNEALEIASRKAKNPKNLLYVERYKKATLVHDVVGKHNNTKVYIWARPPGRGTVAGSLLKEIFTMMGISDASARIIGPRNPYSVVHAIFNALSQHESLEDIALKRGKRILSLNRVLRS